MAPTQQDAVKRNFAKFLGRKGLRLTSQREAILQAVFHTKEHFTAEQLLEWSRRVDRSVSRATIYRTLPLLRECGLLLELDFGQAYKFYDPNYAEHPNHSHIICQECGKIVEFESEKIARLEEEIGRRLGFSILSRRLQISASCDEFRKIGFCTRKEH